MKKTITACAVAAFAVGLYAIDSEATLPVTGSAKEYTKTAYTITEKFGDYYRAPSAKYVHIFDASGRETETVELTAKDSFVERVLFTYNDSGKLVNANCVDADGRTNWKIVTTYDSNGNKLDESEYNANDVLTSKTIWKFTNRQSEEAFYNADGGLLGKTISKYDDQNRPIEVCQYNANGQLELKRTYVYNDANKLAEVNYFGGDGVQERKLVYRFDANYAITEAQTYNAAGKLTVRVIYKYDSSGNVAKTTTYNVAEKFGTTVNELVDINEYAFKY